MSVDFDAVGGVGIRVPESILEAVANDMDEELVSREDVMESMDVEYITYGNAYSGVIHYAWVIPSDSMRYCEEHVTEWIDDLNKKLGVCGKYTTNDLEVITETYIN